MAASPSARLQSPLSGGRFTAEEDAELLRLHTEHRTEPDVWNVIADSPFFSERKRLAGHIRSRHIALAAKERERVREIQLSLLSSQVDDTQTGAASSSDDSDIEVLRRASQRAASGHAAADGSSGSESSGAPRDARLAPKRLGATRTAGAARRVKSTASSSSSSEEADDMPIQSARKKTPAKARGRSAAARRASDVLESSDSDSEARAASAARPLRGRGAKRLSSARKPAARRKRAEKEEVDDSMKGSEEEEGPVAAEEMDADAHALVKLVDPSVATPHMRVYRDGRGIVYSVYMEKHDAEDTAASGGRMALIQVLVARGKFSMLHVWGRMHSNNPGHTHTQCSDAEEAINRFTASFTDRTGNDFSLNRFVPIPGKYVVVGTHAHKQAQTWEDALALPGLSHAHPHQEAGVRLHVHEQVQLLLETSLSVDTLARALLSAGVEAHAQTLKLGALPASYFDRLIMHARAIAEAVAGARGGVEIARTHARDVLSLLPMHAAADEDDDCFSTQSGLRMLVHAIRICMHVNDVAGRMYAVARTFTSSRGHLPSLSQEDTPADTCIHPVDHMLVLTRIRAHALDASAHTLLFDDVRTLLRTHTRAPHAHILTASHVYTLTGAYARVRSSANVKLLWLCTNFPGHVLTQGVTTLPSALPHSALPFGRGLAASPHAIAAAYAAVGHLDVGSAPRIDKDTVVVLLLCAVTCGTQHATTRLLSSASLPEGCHSVRVCGRITCDGGVHTAWPHGHTHDTARNESVAPIVAWSYANEMKADAVVIPHSHAATRDRVFTASEYASSDAMYDMDVVFDAAQVRPLYAVRATLSKAPAAEAEDVDMLHAADSQPSVVFTQDEGMPW